jgi:PAS domain S-box-containing protein
MNPFAIISLIAAIICMFLANFIYYYNPKNRLNRLMAVLALFVGFLAFVEFAYRQAETLSTAIFWLQISFLWPFVPALMLNIALIFRAKFEFHKNKILYLLIYIPAIIISGIGVGTNLLTNGAVLMYYGWTYNIPSDASFFVLMSFWTILYALTAVMIFFSYYKNSKSGMERKQAKYIFIGLYIPLILSLVSDIIIPLFWQRIPEMTMTLITIGLAIIAYGMWKYQFPLLSPSMNADTIINTMSNILIILDHKYRIVKINPATSHILGYLEEELYQENIVDILEDGEKELLKEHKTISNPQSGVNNIEVIFKTRDKKLAPVLLSVSSLIVREDQPPGILCIGSDLRLEEMKKALHESEEHYRSLVKTNPDSIIKTDIEGNVVYVSPQTLHLHGYTSEEELIGKHALEFFAPHERERITENMRKTLKTGFTSNQEYDLLKKDGSIFIGELNTAVIQDMDQKPIAFMATSRDITHHKEAEKKIKESLKEKEILLKEIHHRVKNNLQIISSLLSLQSMYVMDEETKALIMESQNRVKSMAMIHERLYQSQDLAHINFGSYLKSLIENFFSSYMIKGSINPILEVEDVILDINTAIPLGLISNEIISNSFKHAFPGDLEGEIKIKLVDQGENYILTIGDNGVGFPQDFDYQNTSSLGMQLINSLSTQIGGNLEIKVNNGTIFKLTFPKNQ